MSAFVKQYQVDLDPNALIAYKIPLADVVSRIKASNSDVGGKIFEVATTEYYVRGRGYIKSLADIENIVLKVENGTPIYLKMSARCISAATSGAVSRSWTGEGRRWVELSSCVMAKM